MELERISIQNPPTLVAIYAWNRDGQAGADGDGVRSGEAFLGKAFGLVPENSGDRTPKRVYTGE